MRGLRCHGNCSSAHCWVCCQVSRTDIRPMRRVRWIRSDGDCRRGLEFGRIFQYKTCVQIRTAITSNTPTGEKKKSIDAGARLNNTRGDDCGPHKHCLGHRGGVVVLNHLHPFRRFHLSTDRAPRPSISLSTAHAVQKGGALHTGAAVAQAALLASPPAADLTNRAHIHIPRRWAGHSLWRHT